jgi:hypothetical protein
MRTFVAIVTLAFLSIRVSAVATPQDSAALAVPGGKPLAAKVISPTTNGPVQDDTQNNNTLAGVAITGLHTDITAYPSVPSLIVCTAQNCGGSCGYIPFSSLSADSCYATSPAFFSAMAYSPSGAGFNFGVSTFFVCYLGAIYLTVLCRSMSLSLGASACPAPDREHMLQHFRWWSCYCSP